MYVNPPLKYTLPPYYNLTLALLSRLKASILNNKKFEIIINQIIPFTICHLYKY